MECQILTMALRQSWSSRDPVGTVNAAGILNEIFPDLVSEYSSNPNPPDLYNFLELNPDAGPMVIRKAYHYAVRRFLRENKGSALRRKRAEFFQVLDAGIVMRKSRLRLSHDLAVLRAQLIANRIIGPDGNFVLAGRTKDETQIGPEIPEILEKLISRKVIGRSEARAILNQMVLFPNISCRDLIISAGYVTEHELDVIIEATQSEATGQFEKLQLAAQPISSHSPSRLVAPPAANPEQQWAQAAPLNTGEEGDKFSQPASRQVQSNTGPLSAPRPPAQSGAMPAPRPAAPQDKPLAAPRPPVKDAPLSAPRPPSGEMARASDATSEAQTSQDGESLASALSPGLLAKAMAASQPPDSLSAALSPEVLKKALIESQQSQPEPTERMPQSKSEQSDSLGGQLSPEFLKRADQEANVQAQSTSQPNMSAFMAPWPAQTSGADAMPASTVGDTGAAFGQDSEFEDFALRQQPAPLQQGESSRSQWAPPQGAQEPSAQQAVVQQAEPAKSEQLFSSPFEIWEMPKEAQDEPHQQAHEPVGHSQSSEPFSALIKHEEPPPEEPPSEPSKLFVSEESVAQYTPRSVLGHAPQEPPIEPEPQQLEEPDKSQLAPHQRFPEPDEPESPQSDAGIIVDATPLKVPVPPQLEFSAGVAATSPAKVSPRPYAGNISEAEKLKKFLDDEAKVKAARAKIREREAAQNEEMEKAWQRERTNAPAAEEAAAQAAAEAARVSAQTPAQPTAEAPLATPDEFDDDEFEDEFSAPSEPAKPALKDWTQLPNVSTQPDVKSTGGGGMPLLDWGEPEPIDLGATEPAPIEPIPEIEAAPMEAASIESAPSEDPSMESAPVAPSESAPGEPEAALLSEPQSANPVAGDFDFPDEEFHFAEPSAPTQAPTAEGIEFNAQKDDEGISFNASEDQDPDAGSFDEEDSTAEAESPGGIDFKYATVEVANPMFPDKSAASPPMQATGSSMATSSADVPVASASEPEPAAAEPAKQDSIISKPSFLTPPPSFLSQPPSFLTPPASMRGKKESEAAKSVETPQQPAEVSSVPPIKESAETPQQIEKKATSLDEENDLALQLMMIAGLVTNEQAEALEKQILAGEGDSVYTLAVSGGYATSTEIAIVRRAEDLLTALSQDRKGSS